MKDFFLQSSHETCYAKYFSNGSPLEEPKDWLQFNFFKYILHHSELLVPYTHFGHKTIIVISYICLSLKSFFPLGWGGLPARGVDNFLSSLGDIMQNDWRQEAPLIFPLFSKAVPNCSCLQSWEQHIYYYNKFLKNHIYYTL